MNMKTIAITVATSALLSACATTHTASLEEGAYCKKMAEQMGTDTAHDHGEMKGMPTNGMNITHARCREIMAAKQ